MKRVLCLLALAWCAAAPIAQAGPLEDALEQATAGLDRSRLRTGVLYDRVLPLSGIERFSGAPGGPAATRVEWLQVYDEMRRAAVVAVRPATDAVREEARRWVRSGVIPIATLDDRFERSRGGALDESSAFAVAALTGPSHRGANLRFAFPASLQFSNRAAPAPRFTVDFGDGRGPRAVRVGETVEVSYGETGPRPIRVWTTGAAGETREASAAFEVRALGTPTPDDTLHVTAAVPFEGVAGTGSGYVYLAPGHATLVSPVVVVEGFDLDNSLDWDGLYALLNQQGLIEELRARGHDAVVLDFTDATEPLQRNAMVVTELIEQVSAQIAPQQTIVLAGASMGGLLGRYALAWLETQSAGHRVRTFLSFDAPHRGANIPLGIQYWVQFFSGQSAEAAYLLGRLNRPAARQMLAYHYVEPPSSSPAADPLRAAYAADLAAVGGFPSVPRTVAIANGSGTMANQGFGAGAQIVQWNYNTGIVVIRGNVFAVPAGPSAVIFDGRLFVVFVANATRSVSVSGTLPYDNAPGGWRSTMADMDAVAAPFGDIVALHPNHCFVPTTSALDLAVGDLFHDIAGDGALLSKTPFDAVYVPAANQEHVEITAENAAWILAEVENGVTAVAPGEAGEDLFQLRALGANPFGATLLLGLTLARPANVEVRAFGLDGRVVAEIARGTLPAGVNELTWRASGSAPPGIYFVRATVDGKSKTLRVARVE